MPTNPIVERLRKLIAHERSAREIGSIAEAEAFASKIQQLLDEHKLGMSDVEWADREEQEPIDWIFVSENEPDFEYSKSRREWQYYLASSIAKANACHCVLGRKGNTMFFIGRTSDRELCKILFVYLIRLSYDLNELCAQQDMGEQKFKYIHQLQSWQDFDLSAFRKWMREYKSAWFAGFSVSVCGRLNEQAAKAKTQAYHTGAIVHINREDAALKQYVKQQKLHRCSAGRRESTTNVDGYNRGKQTGSAVNLSPNVFKGTSGRTARLLGA